MDTETINPWLAVLIGWQPALGLIIGVVITAGFNLLVKRVDFTNDYFKKIVEKRIAACEMIDGSLRPFLLLAYDGEKLIHSAVYEGFTDRSVPGSEVKKMMTLSVDLNYAYRFNEHWVNDELATAMGDLVNYIRTDVDKDFWLTTLQFNKMKAECIALAHTVYEPLKQRVDLAYKLLQNEYTIIYDVDGFLKTKQHIRISPFQKAVMKLLKK